MRSLQYRIGLFLFLVGIVGLIYPPQRTPRLWQQQWGIPNVVTKGSPAELANSGADYRAWVGRQDGKVAELKFSSPPTREEAAIADGRVLAIGRYHVWMAAIVGIGLFLMIWPSRERVRDIVDESVYAVIAGVIGDRITRLENAPRTSQPAVPPVVSATAPAAAPVAPVAPTVPATAKDGCDHGECIVLKWTDEPQGQKPTVHTLEICGLDASRVTGLESNREKSRKGDARGAVTLVNLSLADPKS